MGRIYAIANQKGGVGKTTTAVNLGSGFARLGQKVLVVDMDQQCNATVALGGDKSMRPSSYEVLEGDFTLSEAAQPGGPQNMWLVPGSPDLAGSVVELPRLTSPNTRLREQLGTVKDDFDFILIDSPPSLNILTLNALVAADSVLVPIQCEYFALEGLTDLFDTMARVRRALNPHLAVQGILLTMFDERTNLSAQVRDDLMQHFQNKVLKTVIPRNVRLAEAPSFGRPALLYDIRSKGAESYIRLAKEILSYEKEGTR